MSTVLRSRRILNNICKKCHSTLQRPQAAKLSNTATDSAAAAPSAPWRVVSGVQPTGELHVGNYFGALRRCVQLQQQGHYLMLFIADLHALTSHQAAGALRENVLSLAATMLACGADPDRGVLWAQSAVPRHAELCWLLACVATQARLSHLPHFKEKGKGSNDVELGLLLYPVLQAADVLALRASHVPVGADQLPHLQLAAALHRSLCHRHPAARKLPPPPQAMLAEDGSDRIRSLRDPSKKMSKSEPDAKSRVLLTDSDAAIARKVRKAVTDFTPQVTWDPAARPGVSNLVRLHCLASGLLPEEAVAEAELLTTAQYKARVAAALCEHVAPIRERAAELRARPALLRDVLRHGAAAARREADDTWALLTDAVGLSEARAPPDLLHVRRRAAAAADPVLS